jgi:hypothetical protein
MEVCDEQGVAASGGKRQMQLIICSVATLHLALVHFDQIEWSRCLLGIAIHCVYFFHFLRNYPIYSFNWPMVIASAGNKLTSRRFIIIIII